MKRLAFFTATIVALGFGSCSTSYECDTDAILTDGNNNPIDTTTNTEEFCTADSEVVTAKEEDGADCRGQ